MGWNTTATHINQVMRGKIADQLGLAEGWCHRHLLQRASSAHWRRLRSPFICCGLGHQWVTKDQEQHPNKDSVDVWDAVQSSIPCIPRC